MTDLRDEADPLPLESRERIARAIHERYRKNQIGRKPATDPAMLLWEHLPEALKDSNRAQASDIEAKLRAIGCRIEPAIGEMPTAAFSAPELERLAILEHERWVAERRAAGWTLGPVKDVDRKISPYLVPWEQLAEEIREYDRDAVRAIPEVLAEARLMMLRS